jgi:glycerophosphoryl diester phosphodiesterase
VSAYFDDPKPRVLAHRGLAIEAPENTLLSFESALAAGAGYVETDVHASHDRIAVISHDPDLSRLAGRAARIDQLTISELRRIDLGDGQRLCTLAEALSAFPETRFNIDLKHDGVIEAAAHAIRRADAIGRVLVTSFSDARRSRAASLLPGVATSGGRRTVIRCVAAVSTGRADALQRILAGTSAVQVPERAGRIRVVTPRFIEAVHRAGVEVHVWTVNDPADMARLLDLGVDGLVTDRADLAVKLIRGR